MKNIPASITFDSQLCDVCKVPGEIPVVEYYPGTLPAPMCYKCLTAKALASIHSDLTLDINELSNIRIKEAIRYFKRIVAGLSPRPSPKNT